MTENPDFAVDMFRSAVEQREIELKYYNELTLSFYELWEWIDGEGEPWRKGKHGPIPIRHRQAIKALVLHEHLEVPWVEIVKRLGLQPEQQKSLENTVSTLRKLIQKHKIDFDVKPPRKITKSSKPPLK